MEAMTFCSFTVITIFLKTIVCGLVINYPLTGWYAKQCYFNIGSSGTLINLSRYCSVPEAILFSIYSLFHRHMLFWFFVATFPCFRCSVSGKHIKDTVFQYSVAMQPQETLNTLYVWSVTRTHSSACCDTSKTQGAAECTRCSWKSQAGKPYHGLSVCSSPRDEMGFDSPAPSVCSSGSSRRSKGPWVWQRQCYRAQGTEHQPPLSDVIRAFLPSHTGQTFPRP